jgi:hypothetical protein
MGTEIYNGEIMSYLIRYMIIFPEVSFAHCLVQLEAVGPEDELPAHTLSRVSKKFNELTLLS